MSDRIPEYQIECHGFLSLEVMQHLKGETHWGNKTTQDDRAGFSGLVTSAQRCGDRGAAVVQNHSQKANEQGM